MREHYMDLFFHGVQYTKFICQNIIFLEHNKTICEVALSSPDKSVTFARCRKILSKFITTCFQILETRKQLCRSFYYWLLGYRTMYAPREKAFDVKLKTSGFNNWGKGTQNWAISAFLAQCISQNESAPSMKPFATEKRFQIAKKKTSFFHW